MARTGIRPRSLTPTRTPTPTPTRYVDLAEDAAAAHERLIAKLGKPSEAEAGEGAEEAV